MPERNIDKLTEALSAPLGDLIFSIANGVAQAQKALDMQTLQTFKEIYNSSEGLQKELQRIGYQPTWYKIPEVEAEITMTLSISERETLDAELSPTGQLNRNTPMKIFGTPVDAQYTNRFGYDIQGASTLKFKVVAVPPSPQAEELKVVPSLEGKSLKEAVQLLGLLGITFEVKSGENLVTAQEEIDQLTNEGKMVAFALPQAGEILKQNEGVILNI